jgi:arginine repressor
MIGFNQVDYTIDENTGTVLLSVSIRNGNIPEAETRIITLTTSDGTAQSTSDYMSMFNEPLTFTRGSPDDTVTITIRDDTIVEGLESFVARLSVNTALYPGVRLAPDTANVSIRDDDVVIGFNQVDYTIEENTGMVMLSVSVLEGNIPEAESRIITLTTSDGTAQAPADYISVSSEPLTLTP